MTQDLPDRSRSAWTPSASDTLAALGMLSRRVVEATTYSLEEANRAVQSLYAIYVDLAALERVVAEFIDCARIADAAVAGVTPGGSTATVAPPPRSAPTFEEGAP